MTDSQQADKVSPHSIERNLQLGRDSLNPDMSINGDNGTPRASDHTGATLHATSSESLEILPKTARAWSKEWTCLINRLRRPLMRFLQFASQLSARNPKRTIVAVTLFTAALGLTGFLANFSIQVDEQVLWTPHPSVPVTFSDWIETDSGFPKSRTLGLFFHSGGENVINRANIDMVFQVMDLVHALPNYDTICEASTFVDSVTGNHTCQLYGVVLFWNSSWALYNSTVQSEEDLRLALSDDNFPDGTPVIKDVVFGFPEYQSIENGNSTSIVKSEAFTVVLKVPDVPHAEKLEYDIIQVLLEVRSAWQNAQNVSLRLELAAQRSFADESTRAIVADLPLVPFVFSLMIVFTSLVFYQRDRVKSRCFLGFLAVVSVLLSIITGYGLVLIVGVPFTPLTELVPFIIFGIGLDDAYIILGSYIQTNPRKSTLERLQETIEEVGLSISITSFTSVAAFASSCITTVPAVHWLCLYIAPTIMVVYFYQITFFVACIALDDRRINAQHKDCACFCFCSCCTKSEGRDDGDEHLDCCHGNTKERPKHKQDVPRSEDEGETRASDPSHDEHASIEPCNERQSEHIFYKLMLWYAEFLLRPWVKIIVLLSFTLLFALGVWSTTKIRQSFEFTDVLPADSYLTAYYEASTAYTEPRTTQPEVFFRFVNQSDPEIQQQMFDYIEDLVGLDSITKGPDYFWLRDFKWFVNYTGIEKWAFTVQLDWFLYQDAFRRLYKDDIVRDSSGNVVESRCSINMDNVDIENVKMQIDALKAERNVTSSQPLNLKVGKPDDWPFFTYVVDYDIWEFYSIAVSELVFSTWTTVLAVLAIGLFMIPHWSAVLILTPIIAVVYIELVGIMQWGGIAINAVSYVTLVMSIGLFVDYIMHVLLRYYECSGNRREKVVETLTTMGVSILTGGISTFLGVLPLLLASSQIFYTVFITFLGLVTLGLGHGLILVPVVLSYIGTEEDVDLRTGEDEDVRKARAARTGKVGELVNGSWVVCDLDCSIHRRA